MCKHLWAQGGSKDYEHGQSMLEHYKSVERGHRALMRKSLARVSHHFSPGARLLDFGCGPGLFVLEARSQGYDAVGLDIASWVSEAAAHWNVPLDACRLEDAPYEPESFDAVVSVVSFEHLDDPAGIVPQLVKLLRPSGVLAIVSIPHGCGLPWRLLHERWWDLHPPSHRHFFSRRSMQTLLERNGLRVVSMKTVGVGTEFFGRLFRRPSAQLAALDSLQRDMHVDAAVGEPGGSVLRRFVGRLVVPAMNWALDVTHLGNNLTAVAVKAPRVNGPTTG